MVQNPPQKPLTMEEMDAVYDLPYCRTYHPSYESKPVVSPPLRRSSSAW